MKYKWIIKENNNISDEFIKIAFGSEIIAKLLLNRGINTPSKAKSYLFPEFYEEKRPEEIPDLVKAKNRIIQAIKNKEKITIYGDYDVDGVTSTSCLLIALRQFTDEIDYYIPSRLTEGYGLNNEAVKLLASKGVACNTPTKLLITCDCGITNHKEIELANSLGMDVIVTDHHSLPEILPPAVAVLNPKLLPEDHKLHWLPGVGVAYKLAEAILEELSVNVIARSTEGATKQSRERNGDCHASFHSARNDIKSEDLLDLVTLGMIADLAPLVDENRYLVQIGLPKLASTEKVGLKELLKACGCNVNEPASRRTGDGANRRADESATTPNVEHIGFGIAPRINAVGRLTDAKLAVKLLTTDNLFEAVQIACELENQNRERQSLCEETLKEAVTLVSEQVDLKNDKCIILSNENWHHGVIGIVASRLVERFSLPTILIAVDKEQNIARGSGRSIGKLNIVEAVVANSKHLEKFGGHKAACGLSVKPENLDSFKFDFKNYVNDLLNSENMEPILNIDLELSLGDLNMELINKIYKLSPYGLANPVPLFSSDETEVVGIRQIGKQGQHLKLTLKAKSDKFLEALIWNYETKTAVKLGDKIKIAYTPKLNFFNGETSIQLEVKDIENVSAAEGEPRQRRAVGRTGESVSEGIKLFDHRGKIQECINLFSKSEDHVILSGSEESQSVRRSFASLRMTSNDVIYFAETEQKNHFPLKTNSRKSIQTCQKLVFLECPPDEFIFIEVIKKSEAKEIYLAFPENLPNLETSEPQNLLKRLIGMLKYVKSNKNGIINELELQSALGLNKYSLAYGLEILKHTGFLDFKKTGENLNVDIMTPARQNFSDLIEYTLFVSEVKQINSFKRFLSESKLELLHEIFRKNGIYIQTEIKERVKL